MAKKKKAKKKVAKRKRGAKKAKAPTMPTRKERTGLEDNEFLGTFVTSGVRRFNEETRKFETSFDMFESEGSMIGMVVNHMFVNQLQEDYGDDPATVADVRNELEEMMGALEGVAEEYGDDATLDSLKWVEGY